MSRIALSGNPSGSGTLTIASPNTNSDVTINLPTVTGGNFIVSNASGNVGIGTSSPTRNLQLNSSTTEVAIKLTNSTSGAATGDGTDIKYEGLNLTINNRENGSIVFETNNTTRATIDSAGTLILNQGQIQFPATQNPSSNANTLDDYEEGTFTPVYLPETGAFTHSEQVGRYIKIGKMVYFTLTIRAGRNTASGIVEIGGLPFTSVNTLSSGGALKAFIRNFLTDMPNFQMWVRNNSTRVGIYKQATNATTATALAAVTDFATASTGDNYVIATGMYETAS